MTIAIPAPGQYHVVSHDAPKVGHVYTLEDTAKDTEGRMNRAFHALVQEYWRCGLHSYEVKSFKRFRELIKRDLGAGFESFIYATLDDGKPVLHEVDTYDEIPEAVRRDPDLKKLARGRLKSWGDYTRRERHETISRLIAEMDMAGVNTPKYQEILEGMCGTTIATRP
jgi:hypothetical protein